MRKPPPDLEQQLESCRRELAEARDQLAEALERQAATSEVLGVISSSPGELEPVFEAMLANAVRICAAKFGTLFRYDGKAFHTAASVGTPPALVEFQKQRGPFQPGPEHPLYRLVRTKQVSHTADGAAASPPNPAVKYGGARSILHVPMLHDEELVGAFSIFRQEVRPFTEKQIELVTNFAAQAVIAIENTRLLNELRQRTDDLSEALEQQTATSEVLGIISSSPGALEPVFNTMLANATRLCEARFASLNLSEGDQFRRVALHNAPAALAEHWRGHPTIRPHPGSAFGRAVHTRQAVQVDDIRTTLAYVERDPIVVAGVELGGYRTVLVVPMLKEKALAGVISIYRQEVRPFTDKQIELIENFAKQAVIAIENSRLLNELRELLQEQTATSQVLGVISSSPGDLAPVFQAMLENATRICEAQFGVLFRYDGTAFEGAALVGVPPRYAQWIAERHTFQPLPGSTLDRIFQTKAIVQSADLAAEQAENPAARYGGARSYIAVPMLKNDKLIGAVGIYRTEVRPFSGRQMELVSNFANQAVIAIENTRLLNELRQRTDDLGEALEQQTATSEVLRVISGSPSEIQPVFEIIGERAEKLCDAEISVVSIVDGDLIRLASINGMTEDGVEAVRRVFPMRRGDETVTARAIRTGTICHVPDVLGDSQYQNKDTARVSGYRACLGVPMVRDGQVVGAIFVARRQPSLFADAQVQLLKTFADQAVIAVENVRLFNETKEALEQQTATSEVLRVISSSPGELEPVFQAMLENATRLCEAEFGTINFYDGDQFRSVAEYNVPTAFTSTRLRQGPFRPHRSSAHAHVVRSKQVVHLEDLTETPAYREGDPAVTAMADLGRARTIVVVPMLKESDLVGTMTVYRQEVRPFTAKQIELVSNFATQAVIAIENTRLLSELRESLQQQTAAADVLKVISRSTFDLQAVLNTLVELATRLCDADHTWLFQREGEFFRWVAGFGHATDVHARLREFFSIRPVPVDRGSITGRAALDARVIHIPDVLADPEYAWGEAQKIGGYRAALGAPLLRKGNVVGVIILYKNLSQPFTTKQIELVTTFADQAVIAIENTRLLNDLHQRTDDLSESLQQQTATADVLKVISRSAFDLQVVLQTLTESAAQLCEAEMAGILRPKGNEYYWVTSYNFPPAFMQLMKTRPILRDRGSVAGRSLLDGRVVHVPDVLADSDFSYGDAQKLGGYRTALSVPLLREGNPIGVIILTRAMVRPFTDKQIELVTTFADQAVIAIENVRLFDEVQARTRELTESLEQQTATSEVLRVISSSPGKLEPVFEAMLGNATRICGARFGVLWLTDGEGFRAVAMHGLPPAHLEERRREPLIHPIPGDPLSRLARTKDDRARRGPEGGRGIHQGLSPAQGGGGCRWRAHTAGSADAQGQRSRRRHCYLHAGGAAVQ